MKILICDDEKSIADNIKELVSQHLKKKNIEAEIDVFYSTAEITKKETQYNMAFLDVQIDELDGTEVAKILRRNNPHIILFIITAFDRYLDSAMDINVFRFITKPIEKSRLENSIDKALKMIDNSTIEIILKNSKEIAVVSTEDIMCIEIEGRKTTVISTRGIFDSSESIKDWRKKLSASFFYSPHNSYIINLKFVTGFSKNQIKIADKFTVPIAYRKYNDFKDAFMNFITERG